jgi:hypothetical protein
MDHEAARVTAATALVDVIDEGLAARAAAARAIRGVAAQVALLFLAGAPCAVAADSGSRATDEVAAFVSRLE